jgi:hypothetical protein
MRIRCERAEQVFDALSAQGITATHCEKSRIAYATDERGQARSVTHRYYRFFCKSGWARATLYLHQQEHLGEQDYGVAIRSPWWAWLFSIALRKQIREALKPLTSSASESTSASR